MCTVSFESEVPVIIIVLILLVITTGPGHSQKRSEPLYPDVFTTLIVLFDPSFESIHVQKFWSPESILQGFRPCN